MDELAIGVSAAASRLPWALLVSAVAWFARSWAKGTIVHHRELDEMREDRDRWRQLALDLKGLTNAAVTTVEKVTASPPKERAQ